MKKIIFLFLLSTTIIFAKEQPGEINKAFNEINKKLLLVKNFSAKFVVDINSIKGKVHQSGTFIQKPPYSFKRDMKMEAMGGIMNVREITVSDGKTGLQAECAPNGKVINASRWGEASMEELFYAFMSKAYLIMITDDITNTYTSLQESIDFDKVTSEKGGFVFTGKIDDKSPKYLALLKIAATLGDAGISNYMPCKVKLVVDKNGIASDWIQYNLKNEPVVEARLSDIVINGSLPKDTFTFQIPKEIIVMDIGQALQRNRIHIKHPLLKKEAPEMKLKYLGGKEKTIKPGNQPIVLTFFASWSGNSRKYLGNIDKLYGKFNLRGVKFVTITDETDTAKIKDFITTEKLTLPIYIDSEKKTTKNYGVHVVPKTFMIDKNGIVVDVIEGNAPGTLSALKQTIENTLK